MEPEYEEALANLLDQPPNIQYDPNDGQGFILSEIRRGLPKRRAKAQPKPPRTTPIKYRAKPVRNPLNVPFKKKLPIDDTDADNLMTLVGARQRGIKYNSRFADPFSAHDFAQKHDWVVYEKDLDHDKTTPNDVVVIDKKGRPRYVNGYYLTKRNPDFLGYTEIENVRKDVKEKRITKQEGDIRKRDIKAYNKTHTSDQSRTAEDFNTWLVRDRIQRRDRLVHQIYMDETKNNPEGRSAEGEATFKQDLDNRFPELDQSPGILIRKGLSTCVKNLETQGFIFRDKFKLLQELYSSLASMYRRQNPTTVGDKLTYMDLLNIYNYLRNNFLDFAVSILQRYTLKQGTVPQNRHVGEAGGVRVRLPGQGPPPTGSYTSNQGDGDPFE
jgi:hypothetical protein